LTGSFFASSNFTLATAAIALLAAFALMAFVFRPLFGHRLKSAKNGKTRPARLGIVEAFDLDRKRQLVIVRRDNVEHLVMIGGPNDLVIESQIARSESREPRGFREVKFRARGLREKEWPEPQVPPPSPAEAPLPVSSWHKTPPPQPAREELPLELLEGIEQNRERVMPPNAGETGGLEQGADSRKSRLAVPVGTHAPAFAWSAAKGRVRLEPSLGGKTPAAREPSSRPAAAAQRESVSNPAARPIGTPLLRTSLRGHAHNASQPAASRAREPRPEEVANSDLGVGPEPVAGPRSADRAAAQAAPQAGAGTAASGSSVAAAAVPENGMPGRADPLELEMARLLGREP